MPRAQLVAILVVIELAIVGGMITAIRGDASTAWSPPSATFSMPGPFHGAESGQHQTFNAGLHPALTVDIGYADLTILTHDGPQIEVSVSNSVAFGPFRETAPIVATQAGDTVRVTVTRQHDWSVGDNRMVTVIVPASTAVSIIRAGDIKLTGLRATASVTSVGSGDISIDDFSAPELHVSTVNGDIGLHQVAANHIDVASKDGDVKGTGLALRDGNVQTANGDIWLELGNASDTVVNAGTVDGKIRSAGFPAAAQLSATKNGDDDVTSQAVRVGAGGGRLDVHSTDGDIDLHQAV